MAKDDLISRAAVWALVGDDVMTVRPGSKLDTVIKRYANAIDGAPAVDAVPVVYGRWKRTLWFIECSVCGYTSADKDDEGDEIATNFCPNCGAKMDPEEIT